MGALPVGVYEDQADSVRNGLAEMMQGTTVVDIFSDS